MDKIKFVRMFAYYGFEWIEVIYKSGICRMYLRGEQPIPKTVTEFLQIATARDQYDPVFKRTETIFTIG